MFDIGSNRPDAGADGTAVAAVRGVPAGVREEWVSLEGLGARAVLLAWAVSIGSHVLLFVVMFLVPWLSGMVSLPEDVPVSHTELVGRLDTPSPWTPSPEFTARTQVTAEDASRLQPKRFEMMSQVPGEGRPDMSIVGLNGVRSDLTGIGTGGDLSRIGLQVGGATGPTFFGVGGKAKEARRIVYVVDRSGSMFELIDAAKKELTRSIHALRRSQRFHVIFYNAGEPLENPPKKLISATPAAKEALFSFTGTVNGEGSTDPRSALSRAFEVKPDLVFFLSDGVIPMGAEVVALLDRLNKDRKVRVFTIAYVDSHGAELLEKIAREHGGEYRYVSEDDLFP